jgi:hypothetical protein
MRKSELQTAMINFRNELQLEADQISGKILDSVGEFFDDSAENRMWLVDCQQELLCYRGQISSATESAERQIYEEMFNARMLQFKHDIDSERLRSEWRSIEHRKQIIESVKKLTKTIGPIALKLAARHGLRTIGRL